ncbi:DNA starvation/stationary phase protection protein [Rhodobacteraceae bacterium RKSG542]|uniref:Dps family protein n=1 Tax=Pseudovibrio flavus TaxID=2529854 RepID=UPI0012BB7D08|nr:DNA starvation/stationary phase protection protein [Pseudovibrio flavus]MTI18951.1 DNA starvation/stationary phase protection protein [Pseudovibrio flavus]
MNQNITGWKPENSDIHIGMSEENRQAVCDELNEILIDTYMLTIKTHLYHWNVTGPMFRSFHLLTEEQYKNLFDAVDDIAERIRALGHLVIITKDGLKGDKLVSLPDSPPAAGEMVAHLAEDHQRLIRKIRFAADVADDADDYVSNDLMADRLAFHEKALWMLNALQEV